MKKKVMISALALMLALSGCGAKESTTTESAAMQTTEAKVPEAKETEAQATGEEATETGAEQKPTEEPSGFEVSPMLDAAVMNAGNVSRLMKVMDRAEAGEDITIAYIGGSITDGSNASPKATECYAWKSYMWWKEAFPEANISYVNAGIGATDSYIGAHRLYEDVLKENPDVVVVEFSVNDTTMINKETYESILRRCLKYESEPAVISLMLCTEGGNSYSEVHAPVAFKYQVPIISYAHLFAVGELKWEQVGDKDGVHPKNEGHKVIAELLGGFFDGVNYTRTTGQKAFDTMDTADYEMPRGALTSSRYEDGRILYAEDFSVAEDAIDFGSVESLDDPGVPEGQVKYISLDSFEVADVRHILKTNKHGFKTNEAGKIEFAVEATAIGIAYLQKNGDSESTGMADYDVYVDGEKKAVMLGSNKSWGDHLAYTPVVEGYSKETHVIELVPAENNTGTDFEILGICIADPM
ncbi:MAG: hypothetical protein IKO61_10310 [Lachnospiraceae bacterium]|nr:hypothetical protein [Lachnospiraceae bacterium]